MMRNSIGRALMTGASIIAVVGVFPAYGKEDATAFTAAPPDRSAQPDTGPSIEFLALNGAGRATLQLQGGSNNDPLTASQGRRELRIRNTQWKAAFSAPLNADAKFSDIGTLDSLASGFKFELGLSGRMTKLYLMSGDSLNQAHAKAITRCEKNRPTDVVDCSALEKDTAVIQRFVNLSDGAHQGTAKWGANFSVGYDKFDYRDVITLAELSEKKVGYAADAFLSYLFPTGTTSVSAHVKYELGYSAGKKKILCPFNAGPAPIQCFNDPASAPTKDKSVLAQFDLRQYLGKGLGTDFAIAPLITYDVSDDVLGVDIPVYLVSDGKFGLTGGIRAGWRSDTKNVVAGVFVGKSFGHTTQD
jgi:hypothetical protein